MATMYNDETRLYRQQSIKKALNDLTPIIERLMDIGNAPGVSISVLCAEEVVFEKGYGHADLSTKSTTTSDTIYPIASVTKTLTAALCGVLVSQGKLSWNEPVATYLPNLLLPNHPQIEREATLIDILSHRTGLQDQPKLFEGPNGMPLFQEEATMYRALNVMTANPDSFRTSWGYCPTLYAIVTKVIENVTSLTLAEAFEIHLFRPLGMLSTSIVDTKAETESRIAQPYTRTSQGHWIRRSFTPAAYQFPFDTSMGVQSTAADMMKWARAMSASHRSSGDKAREKILPEMDTILRRWCVLPSTSGGDPAYGLGWFVHHGHYLFDDMFDENDESTCIEWPCTLPIPGSHQDKQTILYHSGIGHGFTSSLHIYPDQGDAVVVLGNSSHVGDAVDCISRLVTSVVCDHELSVSELENNLRFYTNLEVGMWRKIESELHHQQRLQQKSKSNITSSDITGRYINHDVNLEIYIAHGIPKHHVSSSETLTFVNAKVRFGNTTNVSLDLWVFCKDTLCLFPDEEDFHKWGMAYMASWAEYLIHLSYEEHSGRVSGLWWQYDASKDGIWFQKMSHSG